MIHPRVFPNTTRSELFPEMKSSKEGPESKFSEKDVFAEEEVDGVAKNRAPVRRSPALAIDCIAR